jgi:hypothetical protein
MTLTCKKCGAKWEMGHIAFNAPIVSSEQIEYWKNLFETWVCPFGCGYFAKKFEGIKDMRNNIKKLETYDPESYKNLRSWLVALDYPEVAVSLMGEKMNVDNVMVEMDNPLRDSLLTHLLLEKYGYKNKCSSITFGNDDEAFGGYYVEMSIKGKDVSGFGYSFCAALVDAVIKYKENE